MGIPVVDIFSELSREHVLAKADGLLLVLLTLHIVCLVVAWPCVDDIIIVEHTSTVEVGGSDRTVRIWILVARDSQRLDGEVLGIACLIEYGLPHEDRGVVAVAAYDAACILVDFLCELWRLGPADSGRHV